MENTKLAEWLENLRKKIIAIDEWNDEAEEFAEMAIDAADNCESIEAAKNAIYWFFVNTLDCINDDKDHFLALVD